MLSPRYLISGLVVLLLAACGGGSSGTPPLAQNGAPNVPDAAVAPNATATRTPTPPESPPPASTTFGSSWGRIAPYQVFDDFPTTGTAMTNAQITADAKLYPMVWGSFNPSPWRAANPNVFVSHYFVPPEDSSVMSGYNLAWWKANHPDWIQYTCDTTGALTNQYAYLPGIGYPDVPLDFSNPAVINFEVYNVIVPFMQANNYNALALDQINFSNIEVGGNPELGQTIIKGNYGCGHYDTSGNPVIRYKSRTDPQYATDMLNWIHTLHTIFTTDPTISQYHYKIFVNHQVQSQSDPNEIALLSNVDLEMIEPGFADYGNYYKQTNAGFFNATLSWMKWVQAHGTTIGIIDKFDQETAVTSAHLEFSIATYLLGNEGSAFLYTAPNNGPGYGYGAEQYHSEYATKIGKPCEESYGGPTFDANNPNLYYRKFTGGLTVVNFGGTTTQNATLPKKTYTDIEGRTVTNPLPVAPNDAYVLTTKNFGSGCQ